MRRHALRAVFIYKEPFFFGGGELAHERARLENSLIYVIVFPSAPHNDILRNNNTVFTSAPHPSLRDTFSRRAKALMNAPLSIQKTSIWYPSGGLPRSVHLLKLKNYR